jgi:hypothetical protein
MAILTIASAAPRSRSRTSKAGARQRLVPRALIRFSLLMTIGIAATTVVFALFGMITGDHMAVAVVGIMTMATLLAITLFLASLVVLFRCLVALCEGSLEMLTGRGRRMNLDALEVPKGVGDHWLDGPS